MAADLRGARLLLRAPCDADLPFLVSLANDESLRGWLRFERPMTSAAEQAWLDALDDDRERVWLITQEDRSLGTIALVDWQPVSRVAEVGLAILRREDRGRGVGEEAMRLVLRHGFEEMGLQKIWLHVHSDNPARRLYARLGFHEEGVLRRHAWKRGAYRDLVSMGLLREEWSA